MVLGDRLDVIRSPVMFSSIVGMYNRYLFVYL